MKKKKKKQANKHYFQEATGSSNNTFTIKYFIEVIWLAQPGEKKTEERPQWGLRHPHEGKQRCRY